MRIPGRDERVRPPDDFVAAEDAARLSEAAVRLLEGSVREQWYEPGNEADRAALALCRLRRARSGERGGPQHGDDAVRAALERASPEAVLWIASRAISYMDEGGFPEAVEIWYRDDELA
jgi:hypothetical protein